MDIFRRELLLSLENLRGGIMNYENFKDIFMTILNIHAPQKKKVVRENNTAFMTTTSFKAKKTSLIIILLKRTILCIKVKEIFVLIY